jgi:N-acetylneuraminic acid mutarotase
MMTWILMGAVSAASVFYALWQRAQARRWKKEAEFNLQQYNQLFADGHDRAARYEAVIGNLKSRLIQLEETIYASDDPAAIRDLFGQLFPSAP